MVSHVLLVFILLLNFFVCKCKACETLESIMYSFYHLVNYVVVL